MEVTVSGLINSNQIIDFIDKIKQEYKAKDPVTIYFNSRGGYVESGEGLAEIIMYLQSMGSKVTAINTGDIMSATTIPWLVCDNRIWDDTYNFLIHNPYLENVAGDADELIKQAVQLTSIENDIADLYQAISEKPLTSILELMQQERPMTIEELIDYKFITDLYENSSEKIKISE